MRTRGDSLVVVSSQTSNGLAESVQLTGVRQTLRIGLEEQRRVCLFSYIHFSVWGRNHNNCLCADRQLAEKHAAARCASCMGFTIGVPVSSCRTAGRWRHAHDQS